MSIQTEFGGRGKKHEQFNEVIYFVTSKLAFCIRLKFRCLSQKAHIEHLHIHI